MRNARRVRLDRGLSVEQVANATGIGFSRIAKFERGEVKEMRYSDMQKLADYYGVSIADLMRPADTPTPEEVLA